MLAVRDYCSAESDREAGGVNFFRSTSMKVVVEGKLKGELTLDLPSGSSLFGWPHPANKSALRSRGTA
jgi:hypothetical protein